MDNFDLKKYLSNNILLEDEEERWDLSGYSYPPETADLDKKVAELKAQLKDLQTQLADAVRIRNKAKSDFTKTVPSLNDQDNEFKNINFSGYSKQKQYTFKKLVDNVKKINEKSGNNWEALKKSLQSQFGDGLKSYINEKDPMLYVIDLFTIASDQDKYVKESPNRHIKIGDWYIRPW